MYVYIYIYIVRELRGKYIYLHLHQLLVNLPIYTIKYPNLNG